LGSVKPVMGLRGAGGAIAIGVHEVAALPLWIMFPDCCVMLSPDCCWPAMDEDGDGWGLSAC